MPWRRVAEAGARPALRNVKGCRVCDELTFTWCSSKVISPRHGVYKLARTFQRRKRLRLPTGCEPPASLLWGPRPWGRPGAARTAPLVLLELILKAVRPVLGLVLSPPMSRASLRLWGLRLLPECLRADRLWGNVSLTPRFQILHYLPFGSPGRCRI